MNEYKLDFSKMTLYDVVLIGKKNPSASDMVLFADHVIEGGVMHLPYSELVTVIKLVSDNLPAYIASIEAAANANQDTNLENLLGDVKGL